LSVDNNLYENERLRGYKPPKIIGEKNKQGNRSSKRKTNG